jgi:hypothetical protein
VTGIAILPPVVMPVLVPVFVDVFRTLGFRAVSAIAGTRARSGVHLQRQCPSLKADRAARRGRWRNAAAERAANVRNRLEPPVVFYAAALCAPLADGADPMQRVLAWLLVPTQAVRGAMDLGRNAICRGAPLLALRPRSVPPLRRDLLESVASGGRV